jgi:hypothetical protein
MRIAFFRHVNTHNAAACGVNHLPATFVFLDAFIKIALLFAITLASWVCRELKIRVCETFTIYFLRKYAELVLS